MINNDDDKSILSQGEKIISKIRDENISYNELINEIKDFDLFYQVIFKTVYCEKTKSNNTELFNKIYKYKSSFKDKKFNKCLNILQERLLNKKIKFLDKTFYFKFIENIENNNLLNEVKLISYNKALTFLIDNKLMGFDYIEAFINYIKNNNLILSKNEIFKLLNENKMFNENVGQTPELIFNFINDSETKSIVHLIYKSFYDISKKEFKLHKQKYEQILINNPSENNKDNEKNNNKKFLKTVYEQFSEYNKEDIRQALEIISRNKLYVDILNARYGLDYEKPIEEDWLNQDFNVIDKNASKVLKEAFSILYEDRKKQEMNNDNNLNSISMVNQYHEIEIDNTACEETEDNPRNTNESNVLFVNEKKVKSEEPSSKNNTLDNLEIQITQEKIVIVENILCKNKNFSKEILNKALRQIINPNDFGILCLTLGFTQERVFSFAQVSAILNIDEKYIMDLTKDFLILYKNIMTAEIDNLINDVSQNQRKQEFKL